MHPHANIRVLRYLQFVILFASMLLLSAKSYSQIVISQIYGGGGNSGAGYTNDYVELFNRGTTIINISGWTVQHASASGLVWDSTPLSGSIRPGEYYLVQEGQGAGGFVSLPIPDATGVIAISPNSAKVALVNSTTLLTGSCPSSSSIVDFVGYGSASCSEQTPSSASSNTTALFRVQNGCTDAGNNANDFRTDSPNPRNSLSPVNPCSGTLLPSDPIGMAFATPSLASRGATVLFTMSVTPGSFPTSSGISVKGDLSPIGGSATQQLFDDATNGDTIAGDSIFSLRTMVSANAPLGATRIVFNIADSQKRTASVPLALTIGEHEAGNGLIFPQVAVGGGYKTVFLLTNPSTNPSPATLNFYSGAGRSMLVTIGGITAASFPITVPANGSLKVDASADSATPSVGWAKVKTSTDLNGNAIFQLFNGSTLFCEASVPASYPATTFDFYAEEEDGFNTGIAIANPGSITAEGALTVRNKQGVIYATNPITLAPLEKNAVFLSQLISPAQSGRVQIEMTKGYVSAVVVRMNSASLFSTISVTQPSYSVGGMAAFFSPNGGVTRRIISEINNAQVSIDVAIYSFTSDGIRDALIAAKNRQVAIRIIADSSQASSAGSEIDTLEQTGIPMKRSTGESEGIMHNKYMIIDGRVLFTGSFNWSGNAEDSNYENAIFIQASPIIQKYQDDFNGIWAK
jgi:hypothetical protein